MGVKKILSITVLALLTAGNCWASVKEHSKIARTFNTPMEVTATCLECHKDAATKVMATSHWTFAKEQEVNSEKVSRGKKNVFNTFCGSIPGNWPRCTSCHIGYGWKDANFDFSDPTRVDCLVCHDTTGSYKKPSAGAGMPAGFTGVPKMDKKPVNLLKVAQNVGKPTRYNCLSCHANGGGGNNVKHGDIDQSLINQTAEIDVHMATGGNNFSCGECHTSDDHKIVGKSLLVSPGVYSNFNCTSCHDAPHSNVGMIGRNIDKHAKRVACQTCHIPTFAKKYETQMSWDWSQANNPKNLPYDLGWDWIKAYNPENLPEVKRIEKEYGHAVYDFKKVKSTYEKNVQPTYAWYNGTAGAYQLGDKIVPTKVTKLNYPLGNKDDENSKIYPFKVHKGNQIYDTQNNYLVTLKTFGFEGDPDAFWVNFDWGKAAEAGMKASGLAFSGSYGFAPTETYWKINHMVSSKEKALKCKDCHGRDGRMNWTDLGYSADPRRRP